MSDSHKEQIKVILNKLGSKTFTELLLLRNELVRQLVVMSERGDASAKQTLVHVDKMSTIEQVAWIYHDHPQLTASS